MRARKRGKGNVSTREDTPEEYASEQFLEGVEDMGGEVRYGVRHEVRRVGERGKRYIEQRIDKAPRTRPTSGEFAALGEMPSHAASETARKGLTDAKQRISQNKAPRTDLPSGETVAVSEIPSREASEAAQKHMTSAARQTGENALQGIRNADRTRHTVKQTARTIKTARRTVKTAQGTVKTTVQTAKAAEQTALKSAQATAKTAKASARAAQIARKVTVAVVKADAKETATAVKGIGSIIASGGAMVMLVIVLLCMAALVLVSGFAIFLPGGGTSTGPTLQTTVQYINTNFNNQVNAAVNSTPHNSVETIGAISWKRTLACYAVKVAMDPNNPANLTTMNTAQFTLLNSIFWQVNTVQYFTKEVDNKVILQVHITNRTDSAMTDLLGFTEAQQEQLALLQSAEFDALWDSLLAGAGVS